MQITFLVGIRISRIAEMPRRKNKSMTDSTLTDSKFCPTTASSPKSSDASSQLLNSTTSIIINSTQDVLKVEELLRKNLEVAIKKANETRLSAMRSTVDSILLNWDSNSSLNLRDLKACRKMYKECWDSTIGLSNNKEGEENKEEIKVESPTITNDETTENTLSKTEKKVRILCDKSEDKENHVFKRPVGRPKGSSTKNNSAFRTPYSGRRRGLNVAVVTPGPDSQRPVSILRRPNPGEMAISMSGSPLLITHNNVPVDVPQISIPLSDGRVMTVVANEDLDADISIFSEMDSMAEESLALIQKILSKKRHR